MDLTDEQIKMCYLSIRYNVSRKVPFEDVEDVVADVWERSLKSLGKCKDGSKLNGRVTKIARDTVAE